MLLLYPSNPLRPNAVDDAWRDEHDAACALGIPCARFSFERFGDGAFAPRPALPAGARVLYRGWMLAPARYRHLAEAVSAVGASMVTDAAAYHRCHHLPGWYAKCADLTPETEFVAPDEDLPARLATLRWSAYFVKDFVKSLTTTRGSVASTPEEVAAVVAEIARVRGGIEGGVCLRRVEPFVPDSEARYFVAAGRAIAAEGEPPALVHELASRIESPFFSVDVARTREGALRLVELGDGQVSDRKEWPAARFVAMLHAAFGAAP